MWSGRWHRPARRPVGVHDLKHSAAALSAPRRGSPEQVAVGVGNQPGTGAFPWGWGGADPPGPLKLTSVVGALA